MLYGRLPTTRSGCVASEDQSSFSASASTRVSWSGVNCSRNHAARSRSISIAVMWPRARRVHASARPGPARSRQSTGRASGRPHRRCARSRDGRAGSSGRSACARDAAAWRRPSSAAPRRELNGQRERRAHAARVRAPGARDVERGAVVHRRADERQPSVMLTPWPKSRTSGPAAPGRGTSPARRRSAARSTARTACRQAGDRRWRGRRRACARRPAQ